ncbi:serine hydrolase [Niabella yanshanensis]|uniref:Serine hydrolase n=1 Tax=Niabella yanshanensis TaxID=577386 RepID=A0ABZ0W629_9BACT|nr:serine hydrolase [Niabella yanshanensis]WQD38581.1 serine hydrolase [Niabella yanshanensis]
MKRYLLVCLLLPVGGIAQNNLPSVNDTIQKVENHLAPDIVYGETVPALNIEQRMKETGVKGLSIAVIKNYQIHWAKGYGWADEASSSKVTNNTRFQAASISKSLNSMGILKLVEEKRIDPEADVNTLLKSWKFPYDSNSVKTKINIYHLLSHTAGLGVHGFPGYERGSKLPVLQQILDGHSPANTQAVRSQFEAGTKLQYSGGGTTISQLIVEDITGKRYHEYMRDAVLKPLGMSNSSFEQPISDTLNLATGYYTNGKPVKGKYHIYPEQAAAGLWTTPTDLAKYIIECQLTLKGASQKVLSPSMMQTRMTPVLGKESALGVVIISRGDRRFFIHNGGNEAFLCTSYGTLEGGDGIVIMTNGEDFSVISELLNSVARVYNWKGFYTPSIRKTVTVPADQMELYTGNYQLPGDTIKVALVNNDLYFRQSRFPAVNYKARFTTGNELEFAEIPDAKFKFINEAGKKASKIVFLQGGKDFEAIRVD